MVNEMALVYPVWWAGGGKHVKIRCITTTLCPLVLYCLGHLSKLLLYQSRPFHSSIQTIRITCRLRAGISIIPAAWLVPNLLLCYVPILKLRTHVLPICANHWQGLHKLKDQCTPATTKMVHKLRSSNWCLCLQSLRVKCCGMLGSYDSCKSRWAKRTARCDHRDGCIQQSTAHCWHESHARVVP